MSYKLKCRAANCSSVATHVDELGRTFCAPCANKAEAIKYGGQSKPIIRLDVQEDKLGEALVAALHQDKREPDFERLQSEAKASLIRYFTMKDKPLLAEALRRAL